MKSHRRVFGEEEEGLIISSESSQSPNFQLSARGSSYQRDMNDSCDRLYKLRREDHPLRRWVLVCSMIAIVAVTILFVLPTLGGEDTKSGNTSDKSHEEETGDGPRSFSTLDPVRDLGLSDFARPVDSRPSKVLTRLAGKNKAFPTNAWYQNLLLLRDDEKPSVDHRAYTIPYVVDMAGPVPGLRVHPNSVGASTNVVQLNFVENYGLTLGSRSGKSIGESHGEEENSFRYSVMGMTPLGVTLEWVRHTVHCAFWSTLMF